MRSSTVRKVGMVVAGLLAMTVGLGAQAAETKITFMTSQAKFKEAYRTMAAAILADHKIAIDFQVVPDDQYFNLLKVKIASGEVPDVFQTNMPETLLDTANTTVDLSDQPWVSRLVNPGLLKYPDGKIHGLPQESSSFFGAVYYNKKVFQDLGLSEPKTYKEFLATLDTIKTKGKGIVPLYASDKDNWTTQIFMTLGYSVALGPNYKETYNKLLTNKLKWTDVPEMKKILTDFSDLYKKGYVNRDHVTATYEMAKEAVATGKAAMMLNGEWAAADILSKWPDTQLGAFVIPFADHQLMGTGAYVQGLMVPKAGKNVAKAKEFVKIWSEAKYQNLFFQENPGFPGLNDVDGGKVIPAVKALVDRYVATGNYVYQINDPMSVAGPIWNDLWNYYVEVSLGSKTPDQVLAAWQKKYTAYMKSKAQPGF
jgi:raffinose/stachyose/melibiose transport system substrate-binding protein